MRRKIEMQLLAWKNQGAERKPLIINGARQVGKTYILQKFGQNEFKNMVYVDLETNLAVASFFDDNISPEKLIRYLESISGQPIIPGETLIALDEVQSCERALTALKYFA